MSITETYTDKKTWRFKRQVFCAISKSSNNLIYL